METNFQFFIRSQPEVVINFSKIARFVSGRGEKRISEAFRNHRDDENGITSPSELAIRDNLDRALGAAATMEMMCMSGDIDINEAQDPELKIISYVLNNEFIKRYYERHYQTSLVSLFRLRISGFYDQTINTSAEDGPDEQSLIHKVLSIDSQFQFDKDMDLFKYMLDDYLVGDINSDTFYKVIRKMNRLSSDKLVKCLSSKSSEEGSLLRGALLFSGHFLQILDIVNECRSGLVRSYVINYYSYWLGRARHNYDSVFGPISEFLEESKIKELFESIGKSSWNSAVPDEAGNDPMPRVPQQRIRSDVAERVTALRVVVRKLMAHQDREQVQYLIKIGRLREKMQELVRSSATKSKEPLREAEL